MKRFVGDIRKYAYFSLYAAKTDLKAEVANSYLNWVWWVLEPLCNMLVYYYVFGSLLDNTQQYYIVFIYIGLLLWVFFNKTLIYSVKLVRTNREIVTKVYVPKFILLFSNMMLNGIKLLISLGILAVMMIGLKVPVSMNIFYIIPIFFVLFLLTFGLGCNLLHFGVFIDDLSYAITIIFNMLFFLSGVFYDIETTLKAPLGNILARINPVAVLINSMRNALLYQKVPDFQILGIWCLISIVLCCIGVRTIYKNENSYVKVV